MVLVNAVPNNVPEGFQNEYFQDEGPEVVEPAEGNETNNNPESLPSNQEAESNNLPAECYPKDTLSSADLLPGDAGSTWAQTVPWTRRFN